MGNRHKRRGATSPPIPFGSNIDYLNRLAAYLCSLADKRLAKHSPDAKRFREAKGRAKRLKRELNARVPATLAAGGVLPLEEVAHENGLCRFEKLALAAVLAPTLSHGFQKRLDDLGRYRLVDVGTMLDLLCGSTKKMLRARRYLSRHGKLLSHGLLSAPYAPGRLTEDDFMHMGLEMPIEVSNRLLGTRDEHTRRTPALRLENIVLPGRVRRQVEQVLTAARTRATVLVQWGFGRQLAVGRGLSALFTGDSGVGKSLCARAIAGELGAELHLVRVSEVASKYVGETEKNVAAAFATARRQCAVLFFDEADAFFASRVSGHTSQTFYINQQINSLLTEMENYDGIVVLATNRPEAIDPAFERRLSYRVHFPKPAAADREAIWRLLTPEDAPVASDVDFAEFARDYPFTGGAIKNVLLRAAHEAAAGAQVLTRSILRRCADEEQPLHERGPIGFAPRA